MRRLRYSAQARRDFADIAEWLWSLGASEVAAERFLSEVDAHCSRMAENPVLLGRQRDDLGLDLRSLVHGNYLIFFRYAEGELQIVRLLHGARDLQAIFGDGES